MELIIQLLILALLLLVIPTFVGGIFAYVDNGRGKLLFRWISGQFLLWGGFLLLSVPLIWKQEAFGHVIIAFWCYMAAVMVFAVGVEIRHRAWGIKQATVQRERKVKFSTLVLWILFLCLVLLQMVESVRFAYEDYADAFYISISAVAKEADTMYLKEAYTGLGSALDLKNGLAPFPIWVAFLAEVSGMSTAMVAQVVLPVVFISMFYGIFYLLSVKLFAKRGEERPLFMVFVALLTLFGDSSLLSVENFLLARSSQGKAVLGSIVIPFLLLTLLLILRKVRKGEGVAPNLYVLLGAVTTAGCLCSRAGTLLMCLGVGIVGMVGMVTFRKVRPLLPLAVCCIPSICLGIIYLVM